MLICASQHEEAGVESAVGGSGYGLHKGHAKLIGLVGSTTVGGSRFAMPQHGTWFQKKISVFYHTHHQLAKNRHSTHHHGFWQRKSARLR